MGCAAQESVIAEAKPASMPAVTAAPIKLARCGGCRVASPSRQAEHRAGGLCDGCRPSGRSDRSDRFRVRPRCHRRNPQPLVTAVENTVQDVAACRRCRGGAAERLALRLVSSPPLPLTSICDPHITPPAVHSPHTCVGRERSSPTPQSQDALRGQAMAMQRRTYRSSHRRYHETFLAAARSSEAGEQQRGVAK